MVRTQIQLPDHLYTKAKRIADERELSLAELVRRGLELLIAQFPDAPTAAGAWSLPVAEVGRVRVPLGELRDYAADDEALMVAEDSDE